MASFLRSVARASYQVNKAARTARAFERGGLPAVGEQYAKRVVRRAEIGLLRRMRLWPR